MGNNLNSILKTFVKTAQRLERFIEVRQLERDNAALTVQEAEIDIARAEKAQKALTEIIG